MKDNSAKKTLRFRSFHNDNTYIGEAVVSCYRGTGITDEFGYKDSDEVDVTFISVFDEDTLEEVFPWNSPATKDRDLHLHFAAVSEYYDPTSSLKIFPGEEESYFDGLVSLGKFDDLGCLAA